MSQFARQLTRQATEVTVREKKKSNAPTKIVPKMLVAAKVTPKRITETKIEPSIPVSKAFVLSQAQPLGHKYLSALYAIKVIARKPTAIPKITHRNAGVTVITAVKLKTAAIRPISKLAAMDKSVQLYFGRQLLQFDIDVSPPDLIYVKGRKMVIDSGK